MKHETNFRAAGVTFGKRQGYLAHLCKHSIPDLRFTLKREPRNPHDPNAICVMAHAGGKTMDVGYVPRELAAQVAPVMDNGTFVKIDNYSITGGKGYTYGLGLNIRWYN